MSPHMALERIRGKAVPFREVDRDERPARCPRVWICAEPLDAKRADDQCEGVGMVDSSSRSQIVLGPTGWSHGDIVAAPGRDRGTRTERAVRVIVAAVMDDTRCAIPSVDAPGNVVSHRQTDGNGS